jgi:lipopolysaccharide export system permease protein
MKLGKSKFSPSLIPGFSVMDRYIATELVPPFLFGVGAFSSVGVAVGTLFDLVRKVTESGLLLGIAVKVLLLKMPEFIVYAFPMSTLLAALMTYSRFSSDSELIALRSCGISIYRLVVPAIVLSFIVTGMTFLFNELVVPAANYEASITLDQALKSDKPIFNEENVFFPEYRQEKQANGDTTKILTRLVYAEQFDGQRLKKLTILDWSREGISQIVTAESAVWNSDEKTGEFFNGTIYLVSPDASYRSILRFEHQQLQLSKAPLDLANKGRDYDEMNIAQSLEYLKVVRISRDDKKTRKLEVRIQQKMSFPFVCVVFGLAGAALGTRPQRTGRATSFGVSVVVIFSYYLLSFVTGALGQTAILSPFMAAWLPNFLGLGAGGLLVIRAGK